MRFVIKIAAYFDDTFLSQVTTPSKSLPSNAGSVNIIFRAPEVKVDVVTKTPLLAFVLLCTTVPRRARIIPGPIGFL